MGHFTTHLAQAFQIQFQGKEVEWGTFLDENKLKRHNCVRCMNFDWILIQMFKTTIKTSWGGLPWWRSG